MNLGGEEGEMVSHGRIDRRQKVVWEKRGRGRWVNLSLHSRACVLLAVSVLPHVYEWVWELGQVGGVVSTSKAE